MKLKLLIFTLLCAVMSWGQATLPLTRTTWNSTPVGWTDSPLASYTTTFACSGNNGAKFEFTSDRKIVNFDSTPDKLTFVVKSNSTTTSSLLVQESADGVNYTTVVNLSGSAGLPTTCTSKGPYALLSGTRYIRWTFTKGNSNMTMDDVNITAATTTPNITLTPVTLSGFTYVSGAGPSTTQTFTASGVNLTANLVLNAPANYEIATNSGGPFSSSITLTPSSGTVSNTTIYVRLKAGLPVATYNGELITASSSPATNKTVTCNGSVTTPVPVITVSPSTLTGFSYILGTGPSAEQTFTVSAANLTADLVITPPTNYEISTTSGSGFGSTITLPQVGGVVNATTIYVRLKAGLTAGNYNSQNIVVSSTGATSKNVICSGNVVAPTITVSPATLTGFSYIDGSGPSNVQNFTVSATNLLTDLVLAAPANYEIATSLAGPFVASVTLAPISNTVSSITIYVRLKAALAIGNYNSELINVTSTNATTRTVTCSGSVIPPPPVNDLCSASIELFSNVAPISGSFINSSSESLDSYKDVWYKFTPTCTASYSFSVAGFSGDIDLHLYQTSCPSTTTSKIASSALSSDPEVLTYSLTSGITYYLRVYAYNTTAAMSDFTVAVATTGSLALTNAGSPAAASVSAGTPNYVVMGFTLNPTCASNYGVSTVTLTKDATSTVVSSYISNFRIFRDVNQNGVIDATDISISSSGIPLANSMLFTLNGQSNVSGSKSYLLVADISPLAIAGRTIKVDLNPVSNIVTTIPISGSAIGNLQTIVAQSCTPAVIGSISPAFGPAGTEVTITALSGNLTGATATFNGLTATVISSSATQLVVKVPLGATSGDLVISDAQPCYTGAYFEVISEVISDCEGSVSDLIIYEIFDEESGSGGTIVLYNGTTAPKDLSEYELFRDSNNTAVDVYGNFMLSSSPLVGILAPGQVAILKVSNSDCGPVTTNNGKLSGGFNEKDEFQLRLKSNGTVIDHVVAPLTVGYYLKRNPGSYTANPVYVATDWSYTDMGVDVNGDNECVTMGIPPTSIGRSPIITSQPSNVSAICGTLPAVLSVTAVEGYAGGRPLTYQWYFVAPGGATWIAVTDGGLYSGATTNSLTISDVNPILGYQFYCQVKEDSATCYIATEAIKLTNLSPTTWDGTSWSDGTPTLLKPAVINGNYDTSLNGNIEACSLTINPGFTARVTTGMYFNIQNEVTVLSGANLIINDDGSLVQINDASVNSGNIRYERTANEIHLSDYVYWSSPVQNFLVRNISPTTPAYYHWKWGTTAPNYNNGEGNWVAAYNDTMIPGKGYIVRAPNGFSNTLTQPWNVAFTGVPNNGLITPQVLRGTNRNLGTVGPDGSIRSRYGDNFNLIGNPYPSAISINAFLMENPFLDGFVNVWTHGSLPSVLNPDHFYDDYDANYTPNDYITINSVGVHSGPNAISYIAGGQGFFVEISEDTPDNNPVDTTVTFRNYMRSKTYHNHEFFRPSREESNSVPALSQSKNRIWLDLVGPTNVSHRILVGYVAGATNQRDRMYDAVVGYGSGQSFYSIIDNDIFKIQGKSLPFDVNDRIPLGVKVGTTGVHQIAIAYKDGLFLGNQNIYLEDLHLGVIHDLRATPYSFTASTGIINNRFVLRYTDVTLSNPDIQNNSDVYISTSEVIGIDAINYQIESIQIHNILGQLLFHKRQVNSGSFQISDLQKNNVPLIVQVTLDNGVTITKKIIY